MPGHIRADKQLLVAVMGFTTSLVTAAILGAIEFYTGFAIYSFMLWFILPVGAIFAGFAAASGYYAGSKLFNQKPVGGVLFNMIAAAFSSYFLVQYLPYYLMEHDGVRIKEFISFWKYLDITIRSTSLSFIRGNASTGELGALGYGYAALQALGFSAGGFAVFAKLTDNPFCEDCARYLDKIGQQERFTSGANKLIENIKVLARLIDEHSYDEAVKFHSEELGVSSGCGHHLKTEILIHNCSSCGLNHFEFIASKLKKDSWSKVYETEIKVFSRLPMSIQA